MQVHTRLPFHHLSFRHWNASGQEMGVVVVKASLLIAEGQRANELVAEQPDLLLTDLFAGEVNVSPLLIESDLSPFKPKTDITLHAVAYSPEAKELESWPVSIGLRETLHYGFHVFGARQWEPHERPGRRSWKLSSTSRTASVPLSYDYAYGGTVRISDDDTKSYPFNPIGRGLLSDFLLAQKQTVSAPQIGLISELTSPRPMEPMTVCGFGPIQKSWQPRLALAGTLDAAWLRERHPRMPQDYDFAYWNAAPLPLQTSSYLKGDETIELNGLRHEPEPYVFQLPAMQVLIKTRREGTPETSEQLFNLDTLHIDVAATDQQKHSLHLTWRICLEEPDDILDAELIARRIPGAST